MSTYLPYPSYIDVAPNEYVTRYSFNRNFEKLISNDIALVNAIDENIGPYHRIEIYNKSKTYEAGVYVFYKIHRSDTQFYILESIKTPNTHKPLVRKDVTTGNMYVINSEWWHIVGTDSSMEMAPKDSADNEIYRDQIDFKENHELNLSVHPTRKLGFKESNMLYKTFDNLEENRKTIFFPYSIESIVANNSIYHGYMRKWDNGLLEYDFTFRLGYISSDNAGIELISANNVEIPQRNYNYMYFKNDNDFRIFNQGGEYYTNINKMKQVNLNRDINAYTAYIKFPEPFKDLNYMVFTSGIKNIETEAYNTKNEAISTHDPRFILDGLELVGVKEDASFKTKATVPYEVRNICTNALAELQQTDRYEVQIELLSGSSLINIEPFAFYYSPIHTINIPVNVKHLGSQAFDGCMQLSSVAIYAYEDPSKQVVIDDDAFIGTSIDEISIYYVPSKYVQTDRYEQISSQFLDNNFLNKLGIINDISVYIKPVDGNVIVKSRQEIFYMYANALMQSHSEGNNSRISMMRSMSTQLSFNSEEESNNVFKIDINDLIAELNEEKEKQQMQSKHLMKAASKTQLLQAMPYEYNIEDVILVNGSGIAYGYDNSSLPANAKISVDLGKLAGLKSIGDQAFVGFTQMTSLNIPSTLTSIGVDCVDPTCEVVLNYTSCLFMTTYGMNSISALYRDYWTHSPDEQETSFTLIDVPNIKNLYLRKYDIPSYTISSNYVKNFQVYTNNIESSAFQKIVDISSCEIHKIDVGSSTYFGSNLFYYENAVEDDESPYIIPRIQELNIHGSKFYISRYAFSGIHSSYLSIDTSTILIIERYAFASSDIDILELKDSLAYPQPTIDFDSYAFESINSYMISFPNYTSFSQLCSTYFVGSDGTDNKLAIPSKTQVSFNNGTESYYFHYIAGMDNGKWIQTPPYLYIVNGTLIRCHGEMMYSERVYDVNIPVIVNRISSDAINVSKQNPILSDLIDSIFVPNTVSVIQENAFAGNTELYKIIFERGINFEYVGKNIVSGCNSLNEIVWNKDL